MSFSMAARGTKGLGFCQVCWALQSALVMKKIMVIRAIIKNPEIKNAVARGCNREYNLRPTI
jgi:hypothetical protein